MHENIICFLPGSFPLTSEEGEVVLAMATDESCQWLLAGDTAGYLSLFNIAQFCTALREVGAVCCSVCAAVSLTQCTAG